MGNKNRPPAILKKAEGVKKHDNQFPVNRFTDVKRKQKESDNHTVGGF